MASTQNCTKFALLLAMAAYENDEFDDDDADAPTDNHAALAPDDASGCRGACPLGSRRPEMQARKQSAQLMAQDVASEIVSGVSADATRFSNDKAREAAAAKMADRLVASVVSFVSKEPAGARDAEGQQLAKEVQLTLYVCSALSRAGRGRARGTGSRVCHRAAARRQGGDRANVEPCCREARVQHPACPLVPCLAWGRGEMHALQR